MKTPTKDAKAVEKFQLKLPDNTPCEEALDTIDSTEAEVDPEEAELEELRMQFVGDVGVTEGSCRCFSATAKCL